MGITEIFGKSFNVLWKSPKIALPLFLFTIFIVVVAALLAAFLGTSSYFGTGVFKGTMVQGTGPGVGMANLSTLLGSGPYLLAFIAVIAVIACFFGILLAGTYIALAEQGYAKQKISLGKAFNVAKANYLSMLGANIIYALVLGLIVAALAAIILGIYALHVPILTIAVAVLLILAGLVAVIILGILFYQINTVIVLEKKNAIGGIERSIGIGKSLWGEIFGVLIVSLIISAVIQAVARVIGTVASLALIVVSPVVGTVVAAVFVLLISLFFSSWLALVPVFFYHEYVSKGKAKM